MYSYLAYFIFLKCTLHNYQFFQPSFTQFTPKFHNFNQALVICSSTKSNPIDLWKLHLVPSLFGTDVVEPISLLCAIFVLVIACKSYFLMRHFHIWKSSCHRTAINVNFCFFFCVTGDDAVADDYASIAMNFENQKQYFLAGKFFLKSAQYAKVGKLLRVLLR